MCSEIKLKCMIWCTWIIKLGAPVQPVSKVSLVLYLSFKILQGLIVRALLSPSSWRVNGRTERIGAQCFVCFYVVHITACCPERLLNWGYKTHVFLLYLYLICPPFLWSFSSSISHQSTAISFLPSIQCLSLLLLPCEYIQAVVSTITLVGFLLSEPFLYCHMSAMELLGAQASI